MTHEFQAVFDEESGEIVHVHTDLGGIRTPPEELIQLVDPESTRRLVVRPVPEELRGGPIRLVEGELRPGDEGSGPQAAGGTSNLAGESGGPRRYGRVES